MAFTTNVHLTTEQLHQCLDDFVAVFGEYFGLLRHLFTFSEKRRLLDLSKIGIKVDDLFNEQLIAMAYNFDPTKYILGYMPSAATYFAVQKLKRFGTKRKSWAKKLPSSLDIINTEKVKNSYKIEDAIRINKNSLEKSIVPKGCFLESRILITADKILSWEYHLKRILEFHLAPIDVFLPQPLTLPYLTSNNSIALGNSRKLRLPSNLKRQSQSKQKNGQSTLHSHADSVLFDYYDYCMGMLVFVEREIQRRRIQDNLGNNRDIDYPVSVGKPVHRSGFTNPSKLYSVSEAATRIGMTGAHKERKLKRRIDQSDGAMARLEKPKGRKYYFNRDYDDEFMILDPLCGVWQ